MSSVFHCNHDRPEISPSSPASHSVPPGLSSLLQLNSIVKSVMQTMGPLELAVNEKEIRSTVHIPPIKIPFIPFLRIPTGPAIEYYTWDGAVGAVQCSAVQPAMPCLYMHFVAERSVLQPGKLWGAPLKCHSSYCWSHQLPPIPPHPPP
jgi:hypothetical protein